jgi:hypothetical protein
MVFVEKSAEQVASMHPAWLAVADDSQSSGWVWRFQSERPVRAVPVAVPDVDAQDLLQVASPDDQQPVQALGADGANPPLRVGVRVGRPHWRQEHLGTVRTEDVVEPAGERRVPVAQHKAEPPSLLLQHQQQVAACWATQPPLGLAATSPRWTRRVSSSRKNSTYSRRTQTVSTVKKSQAMIPAACCRSNVRQVVAVRRGAGWSP